MAEPTPLTATGDGQFSNDYVVTEGNARKLLRDQALADELLKRLGPAYGELVATQRARLNRVEGSVQGGLTASEAAYDELAMNTRLTQFGAALHGTGSILKGGVGLAAGIAEQSPNLAVAGPANVIGNVLDAADAATALDLLTKKVGVSLSVPIEGSASAVNYVGVIAGVVGTAKGSPVASGAGRAIRGVAETIEAVRIGREAGADREKYHELAGEVATQAASNLETLAARRRSLGKIEQAMDSNSLLRQRPDIHHELRQRYSESAGSIEADARLEADRLLRDSLLEELQAEIARAMQGADDSTAAARDSALSSDRSAHFDSTAEGHARGTSDSRNRASGDAEEAAGSRDLARDSQIQAKESHRDASQANDEAGRQATAAEASRTQTERHAADADARAQAAGESEGHARTNAERGEVARQETEEKARDARESSRASGLSAEQAAGDTKKTGDAAREAGTHEERSRDALEAIQAARGEVDGDARAVAELRGHCEEDAKVVAELRAKAEGLLELVSVARDGAERARTETEVLRRGAETEGQAAAKSREEADAQSLRARGAADAAERELAEAKEYKARAFGEFTAAEIYRKDAELALRAARRHEAEAAEAARRGADLLGRLADLVRQAEAGLVEVQDSSSKARHYAYTAEQSAIAAKQSAEQAAMASERIVARAGWAH